VEDGSRGSRDSPWDPAARRRTGHERRAVLIAVCVTVIAVVLVAITLLAHGYL
jgi:hypothetical protein